MHSLGKPSQANPFTLRLVAVMLVSGCLLALLAPRLSTSTSFRRADGFSAARIQAQGAVSPVPVPDSKVGIYVFVGTRPEAIKLAPLVHALQASDRLAAKAQVITVNTGQHTDMLLATAKAVNLSFNVTFPQQWAASNAGSLGHLFGRVFQQSYELLAASPPASTLVVVQGDTSTSLAAALAAAYHNIPVAHVEAGLRTFDNGNPFPEELNRRLIDHLSTLLFPPTSYAQAALEREGIFPEYISNVGNTVVDALQAQMAMAAAATNGSAPSSGVGAKFAAFADSVASNAVKVMVTMHRRESQGKMMRRMFEALRDGALTSLQPGRRPLAIIFPVHRNPNVQRAAAAAFGATPPSNIMLTDPLEYSEFAGLYKVMDFILTDSGGIQEESVSLGIPTVVMRNMTERPEGVIAGVLELKPATPEGITSALASVYNGSRPLGRITSKPVYGDGTSSRQIVDIIAQRIQGGGLQESPAAVTARAKQLQEQLAITSAAADSKSSSAAGQQQAPMALASASSAPLAQLSIPKPDGWTLPKLLAMPSSYNPAAADGAYNLTVVASFYRRHDTVKRMLDAFVQSSLQPKEVWLVWFAAPAASDIQAEVTAWKQQNPNPPFPVYTVSGDKQLGYWGRFQVALQSTTPWVAVFDDDCIPGKHFLRNTMHVANIGPFKGVFGVKGHQGRPASAGSYLGPVSKSPEMHVVDVVGGMWFMRSEHLPYMFRGTPYTWTTGEDINLCYNLRVHGGMRCHVMAANYSDPDDMGVSADYLQLSKKDTTGFVVPLNPRLEQEAAYFYKGDFRTWQSQQYERVAGCSVLLYSDHGADVPSMAQVVKGISPARVTALNGCTKLDVYAVVSYANSTAPQLTSAAGLSQAFVIRPGLTPAGLVSTFSKAAKMSDVVDHFSSILESVQPKVVIANTTLLTAETLGVLSASRLRGQCVVGIVDSSGSAAAAQTEPSDVPLVQSVVVTHPVLHVVGAVEDRLVAAMAACGADASIKVPEVVSAQV